ncbi:HalOD1 output domain-containing protein [Halobiforma nitratireducens]|uniref:Halobacterial output domain-containing protein n=1 Tax=Halobiforma nitratireducens JCM 10879 TaxID=1227454 RepID=M0M7M0_9EURY|nr:HalOD1 output domain-containing protein [Halobiforma nitratireducens]EMA41817.1 hypothetical protein C446_05860 [Halobiforma nitratireducens JCM 10879]
MSGIPSSERETAGGDGPGQPVRYDADTGTYRTWCEIGEYEPVSTALVTAISEIRGTEPDELDPLPSAVDPDALNSLVGHWQDSETGAVGAISFTFAECEVTVRSNGEIVIDAEGVSSSV